MLMNSKLISVIVPVYNVEKYLKRCLDSIINQTYKNLEIILIDDGSPDSCGKICDEYAKKDNRIKVIHKENGGVSSARNEGLKNASGDYIAFVDSDDWVEPNMYDEMLKQSIENNADIVRCGQFLDYTDKTVADKFVYDVNTFIDMNTNRVDFIDLILDGKILPSFTLLLIKKEKIDELNLLFDKELIIGEDLLFVLTLLCTINSFYTYNKYFYHYCIHSNSAINSSEKNLANAKNLLNLYSKIEELLKKYDLYDEVLEKKLANYIYYRVYSRICKSVVNLKQKDIIKTFFENPIFASIIEKIPNEKLSFCGKIFLNFAKKNRVNSCYTFCFIYEFLKSLKK